MSRVIVVGNGLFGAAATRHLAERGHQVVCIGAPERRPDIRAVAESDVPEHAVYSSHNDAARLTRLNDRDPNWATTTRRAVGRYRELEVTSGIDFFGDVGCLIASRPGGDGLHPDPVQALIEADIEHTVFPVGDSGWSERWPMLSFPGTHRVAFAPPPAGYIRPKKLIAAQNVLAQRSGAELVTDTVVGIERKRAGFTVRATNAEYRGDYVLVAAGAFTNFNGLLASPVSLRLKSEVIVLGEVSESDAAELLHAPTVKYLLDPGDIDDIYMTPPVRYEDGRYYIKMGANTRFDQELRDLGEIQRWFNTDTDPLYLPVFEHQLRALWPQTTFQSITTRPCIITYTPTHQPLIEQHDDGLFVATGGNGRGAKGSDAWGERAVDLIELAAR